MAGQLDSESPGGDDSGATSTETTVENKVAVREGNLVVIGKDDTPSPRFTTRASGFLNSLALMKACDHDSSEMSNLRVASDVFGSNKGALEDALTPALEVIRRASSRFRHLGKRTLQIVGTHATLQGHSKFLTSSLWGWFELGQCIRTVPDTLMPSLWYFPEYISHFSQPDIGFGSPTSIRPAAARTRSLPP
ncbi:hypothetical protein BX600DRAFT_434141 [Xylariales sp. PMI_506]|nr:hypothetical protein BX600DRAFT_434141 [Xylariales sp. PMI_506]